MGFITSALGLGGGSPKQAPIITPATAQQATDQYGNAVSGLNQQQQFVNALGGLGGVSNLGAAYQNYANLANGVGPNPAMNQLNEATRQNVAQQAGLMASQRGAGANPALIAREAAMQGANTQQQAAGQAATLSAQQQLAGIQGQAGLANQEVGYQQQGIQGYNQFAQNEQGNILNSIAGVNSAHVGSQGSVNSANSSTNQGAIGSIGGIGAAAMLAAHGGLVPIPLKKFANGGDVDGPLSKSGKYLLSMSVPQGAQGVVESYGRASKMATGGSISGEALAQAGEEVPGRASVKGDSLKNDTVKAMLSPGEVVIPRHVMQSEDPASNAAKFVAAVLAKNGLRKKA